MSLLRFFIFILINSSLSACTFLNLHDDLKEFDSLSIVGGKVHSQTNTNAPILVALYKPHRKNKFKLEAFTVRYGSGDFEIIAASGEYYLVAFEDTNEDFTPQNNELVGWHGKPTKIIAKEGKNFLNLNIELRNPEQAKLKLPALYAHNTPGEALRLTESRVGIITDMDDPSFTPKTGNLGMWEPMKFIKQKYHGIYFLEPYDENKIPVLLVHGLTGSGHDWRHVVKNLDRNLFQPWIVQYPSGLRMDLVSREISKEITKLQLELKFNKLIVVAHSMGGLIARGFINHNVAHNKHCDIPLFITISTPWGGHSAAQSGVDNAPVVVPVWYDMVPDSPYLQSLNATPLPADMNHYLFFSHHSTRLINKHSSDGSVTIESQLPLHVQEAATQVLGFDEDHVSILYSEKLTRKLNQLLETETLAN